MAKPPKPNTRLVPVPSTNMIPERDIFRIVFKVSEVWN